MRDLIAITVVYAAILLTFRRLGGMKAAAGWIEDWGRRATSV